MMPVAGWMTWLPSRARSAPPSLLVCTLSVDGCCPISQRVVRFLFDEFCTIPQSLAHMLHALFRWVDQFQNTFVVSCYDFSAIELAVFISHINSLQSQN